MPFSGSHSLPESLYSADAVREIDRHIIEKQGVPGFELMQKAASSAFRCLVRHWPEPRRLLVLCGGGNNGGDGYLVAANAHRHGMNVDCIAVADTSRLTGDARQAWYKAEEDGVAIWSWQDLPSDDRTRLFDNAGLIVDAMLGTGVSGSPREPFAELIAYCNGAACPVLAIDVPSGLDATCGAAPGDVVRAEVTVTFIALKAGLFTGQGPEYSGQVVFESLDTGEWLEASGQVPIARRADWATESHQLPRRPVTAHKGRFGHVLIIAGDRGFGGAGLLAAEAASRAGAGLVSLATRPEYVTPALARCPSVMVHGVIHGSELEALLESATVVVCGPGIGRSSWGQQMLQQVIASGKPQVLDADALNLLSERVPTRADNHVLTPHPGEAARLLGVTVADIESDRLTAARNLARNFGGVVLLKGAGTVIAAPDALPVIASGSNPGMATGGMGDVLSGIIGALYAQLGCPVQGAVIGAALHLAAANRASETKGFMGLLPMDVTETMPGLLAEAELSGGRGRQNHEEPADDA